MLATTVVVTAASVERIAHDLNNLCASMLGFAALAQDVVDPASQVHPYLIEIEAAARKTGSLAAELRHLSQQLRASADD